MEEPQSGAPVPPERPPEDALNDSQASASAVSDSRLQAPASYRPKSGKATASMVLGIVGLSLLGCGWIILQIPSIVLGVLAIIFGKMAKDEIATNPELEGDSKAKAGFIMGIVSTAIGAAWFVIVLLSAAGSG